MMRPPHIQHINPMPPQATTHHIANMPQQQQQQQQQHQQQQPHLNMSTGQQQHNHMVHNHQNYHQNRSGNQHNQHNHHSQQRMNYGQNRPNFHNGSHNMHSVANMSTNIVQSQPKINKVDTNCGIPLQSNAQHRYKPIDATNLANQSSSSTSTTSSSSHPVQKVSIQLASNKENVQNIDRNDVNRGCVEDSSNALNVIAASTTSSKVKTPMCLINELVRSNKLKHQYRVADERGPSHDKLYTVVLELGDENYSAQSKTIKGAQQAAAAVALEKTNYKPSTGRSQRGILTRNPREKYAPNNTITPTVQLNALAMKRGIPTNYSYQYPKSHNEQALNIARNARNLKGNNNKMRFRDQSRSNRSQQFVHRTTEDDPYRVTVTIGDRQFSGTGLTMQSAKHDAAAKALTEFNDESAKPLQSTVSTNFVSSDKVMHTGNGDVAAENNVDRIKSAISVVQEIAQKRELSIRFAVESETGPAHMKHFVIKCSVGEIETTGEGNSKKAAKKHAAENMLNELNKLPPIRVASETQGNGRRQKFGNKRIAAPNTRQQVQQVNARRKGSTSTATVTTTPAPATTATVVKDLNTSTLSTDTNATDENEVSNPISMLLRLQQATKQNEPIYTVVGERGSGNRKEFTMEVSCNGLIGHGIGNSKKVAKREAAKNVLIQLGYNADGVSASGNANVNNTTAATQISNATEKGRKVTFTAPKVFSDTGVQSAGGASGRQLVPGMFLMKNPENNKKAKNNQSGINYTTTATIAKELLNAGTSPTAEAMISKTSPVKTKAPTEEVKPTVVAEVSPTKMETNNNNVGETKQPTTQSHGGIRATDQLLYLAQLLKFEVQFDDFPRGNHKDYLTLASLNTDPPQMFHGSGSSAEASKNQAALAALKALSELGLDNVNKPKSILSNGKSN